MWLKALNGKRKEESELIEVGVVEGVQLFRTCLNLEAVFVPKYLPGMPSNSCFTVNLPWIQYGSPANPACDA